MKIQQRAIMIIYIELQNALLGHDRCHDKISARGILNKMYYILIILYIILYIMI